MTEGEHMRRNFAQLLKNAKIDIKAEYQKLYGMLYDRTIQIPNAKRISVYDELSDWFVISIFVEPVFQLTSSMICVDTILKRSPQILVLTI